MAEGGSVSIEPFSIDATAITLKNCGSTEVNIGGWTLTLLSGDFDENESSYKFGRDVAILAGGSCTVHSSNATDVSNIQSSYVFECQNMYTLLHEQIYT